MVYSTFATLWAVAGLAANEPNLQLDPIEGVTPKNVILILIDDLRYDSLSCTGHPFIKTPHIDRISDEGVQFTRAFVTTSLCSPSRASILSGRYMHNHGVIDNNVQAPPDTVWFPQYLQEKGYHTAFVGKWHMGGASDAPRPGFDEWFSFRGQGFYVPTRPNWRLNHNGKPVEQEGYITDLLTEHAIDWLDNLDDDKPFFLELSHKAVHAMFRPADRHQGKFARQQVNLPVLASNWDDRPGVPMWVKNQRNSWHGIEFPYHSNLDFVSFYREYAETVLAVDDSVGRVLEWLDESGKADDTVVIFLSDNGFLWGEHGLIDKRCSYEESIRIPFVVRAPGLAPPGQKVAKLVANIDIAPTVLELAGLKAPVHMDGRSFVPLLRGETPKPAWRDALLYEYYWEWNFPHTPTQFTLRGDRYKLITYHGIWDTDELFDLENDPEEQNNLIRDPAQQKRVREMRNRLHQVLEESGGKRIPLGNKRSAGTNLRNQSGSKAAEFPPYVERAPRER